MKFSLLLLFIFLFTTSSRTGPSTCFIKIIPVATGKNGTVLFKTSYQINPSGGQFLVPVELGWLVVSSKGVWEEKLDKRLDFDDGTRVTSSDSLSLKEFDKPFNWKNPPKTVRPLMVKYSLYNPVNDKEGRGEVLWTKEGIYKNKNRIHTESRLRSVKEMYNTQGEGTPVQVSFYHQGVTLFRNKMEVDEMEENEAVTGALFFEKDYLYSIDALLILKKDDM
jgi:hypothetical protein